MIIMKNHIAYLNLQNVQKLIDSEKFVSGKKIKINGNDRAQGIVSSVAEKIYGHISQSILGQKTNHSALCKSVEALCVSSAHKKWDRPHKHQEFYDYAVADHYSVFNIDLDQTLYDMLQNINSVYPVHTTKTRFFTRNITKEAEYIRKLITVCFDKNCSDEQKWANIKKILVVAYESYTSNRFKKLDQTFFKKLNRFISFKTPYEYSHDDKNVKLLSLNFFDNYEARKDSGTSINMNELSRKFDNTLSFEFNECEIDESGTFKRKM